MIENILLLLIWAICGAVIFVFSANDLYILSPRALIVLGLISGPLIWLALLIIGGIQFLMYLLKKI